jgi:sugar lactone lactonase YvrE
MLYRFLHQQPKNSFCMKNIQMLFLIALLFPASFSGQICAQTVSTFLTGNGLNGPDGFALDGEQNLFVANWGGSAGATVLKITPGAVVSTFDSTSDAPDGLAFDESGNLYVSNYNSGIIHKITPSGNKTLFASGLINPSALVFDTAGNLYVSNYGSTTVSKITPAGTVSTYASGFSGPLGLVFDPAGNLYVSNYNTGKIHRVAPDGSTTLFATVPNGSTSKIQYLVRGQSGYLYLPSYGHHKIYRISTTGEVAVYAGTGIPGYKDGQIDSAQFNGPNSIALTNLGDLYISEYNANRIRKIMGVEFPVGLHPLTDNTNSNNINFRISPNPFSAVTNISLESSITGDFRICIRDTFGKTIIQLDFQKTTPGKYDLKFDGRSMSPGIYICSLIQNSQVICSRKMIRIK